jgi:hypothetical protein
MLGGIGEIEIASTSILGWTYFRLTKIQEVLSDFSKTTGVTVSASAAIPLRQTALSTANAS